MLGAMSPPTERTRVRRRPDRGRYDVDTIAAILDEGLVCHLGFSAGGRTTVVPTLHVRVGEAVYLHGAPANQALGELAGGIEVCLTVTLLDGLVLSRSAFHHSMNYRSVMVFGVAEPVADVDEKRRALEALVEHVVPGRSDGTRAPSAQELRATLVLRLPITEASAKVRSGGPVEAPEDLPSELWGGHVPLQLVGGEPVPDAHVPDGVPVPSHAVSYTR